VLLLRDLERPRKRCLACIALTLRQQHEALHTMHLRLPLAMICRLDLDERIARGGERLRVVPTLCQSLRQEA
jgi:hypothetical protein